MLSLQSGHQKLARSELQTLMFKGKAEEVSQAVEKCLRVKIDEHDDEVTAGKARAEYLQMRKGKTRTTKPQTTCRGVKQLLLD